MEETIFLKEAKILLGTLLKCKIPAGTRQGNQAVFEIKGKRNIVYYNKTEKKIWCYKPDGEVEERDFSE